MADWKTVSIPQALRGFERRSMPFNRCISSNITMIHGEDGKATVITKHNTFRFRHIPPGPMNITRAEELCDGSIFDDDENVSTTHDNHSSSSSSIVSSQFSRCRSPPLPVFHVKSLFAKTCHGALRGALRELRWKEHAKTDGTFDFYWHGVAYEDTSHEDVTDVHAVNKLPGMLEISHKVQLSRILKRMQNLYPGEFDFYPNSWIFPEQFHQLVDNTRTSSGQGDRNILGNNKHRRCSSQAREKTYIVKPDQGRQGDGIYLVMNPKDIRSEIRTKPCIVQEYIDKPLLLEGYKFDLRIYVVIARLDPIEIYLCKEGLARLCTTPYKYPSKENLTNAFMHLTNYSLNKNSGDFVQTDAAGTGSKRTLTSVEQVLSRKGYDVRKMRREIKQLSVKTVLAVLPDLTIWSHANGLRKTTRCFQILGLDVMLSSDMKAHLLEVNAVPSLRIDAGREVEPGSGVFESFTSAVDEKVKVTLVRDTLELIALGEETVDMSASCLKRIFPTAQPHDYQQGDEHRGKTCQEQNMLKNHQRVPWDPLSLQDAGLKNSNPNFRCGTSAWNRVRHCPHCRTMVVRNRQIQRTPTVINYSEKQEQLMSSDWRFFDPQLTGSTLLKFERQPLVNSFKPNTGRNIADSMLEARSPDEDEQYSQCHNCGGYLNDDIGPGILRQRSLMQSKDDCQDVTTDIPWSLLALRASKSCGDTANSDNTRLFQPRRIANEHYAHSQRAAREGPKRRAVVADDSRKRCHAICTVSTPVIFGKKTADGRVNEPSFFGHHVMLFRRCANVFIYFNGIKASLTMGATAFRNMARRCKLCDQGALPVIDLLYINVLRQWQSYRTFHSRSPCYSQGSDRNDLKTKKERLRQASGLPFQGFIDALVHIASQRYRGDTLKDKMEQLVCECEKYIAGAKKMEEEERLRIKTRPGTLLLPREQQTADLRSNGRARTSLNRLRSRYTLQ